jgi:hypothetical protein
VLSVRGSPPCTDAIIAASIKRVFLFSRGSNPKFCWINPVDPESAGFLVQENVGNMAWNIFRTYDYYVEKQASLCELKFAQRKMVLFAGPQLSVFDTGVKANQGLTTAAASMRL